MLFHGLWQLPWWGYIIVALVLTHITIASVTIFLHRHQSHRSLQLHPIVSHFFRAWLWLTTGMVTQEWVAVHRKHHAKCETTEDPHSPRIYGLQKVLWAGAWLYARARRQPDILEKYGHSTPQDWLERNIYSRHTLWGLSLMALANLTLFGIIPGVLIFLVQITWIPFWAAGVVNGVGHYFGYRPFKHLKDTSRNIIPWGVLIGGEELHNNHHADPASPRLSRKWFEFDLGWLYIRLLQFFGLASLKS